MGTAVTTKGAGVPETEPARRGEEEGRPWKSRNRGAAHRISRDTLLFALGLGIIIKEAFVDPTPSEPLLYLAGLLTGLPVFLTKP